MNATQRHQFFSRLREANPQPTTELEYGSPFELLISVMLAAQATDVSVNKATKALYRAASAPAGIVALGEDRLIDYIKAIGLYRNKAKNVVATCKLLIERHGGEVPADRESLEALPGVGRKTANVVLNTIFGQPTVAVDTHIFRVANRTGLAPGKNVLEVENKLLRRVPKEFLHDAHHWLVLHGRYVCKARLPECWRCIVVDLCAYKHKNLNPPAGRTGRAS
jgi:endonuclease-3